MADPLCSDAHPAARALALDGVWYSCDEFVNKYGPAEGERLWNQARADPQRRGVLVPSSNIDAMPNPLCSDANPAARTLALDGEWYSFNEFENEYRPYTL